MPEGAHNEPPHSFDFVKAYMKSKMRGAPRGECRECVRGRRGSGKEVVIDKITVARDLIPYAGVHAGCTRRFHFHRCPCDRVFVGWALSTGGAGVAVLVVFVFFFEQRIKSAKGEGR
jgi:hypothetical protein